MLACLQAYANNGIMYVHAYIEPVECVHIHAYSTVESNIWIFANMHVYQGAWIGRSSSVMRIN